MRRRARSARPRTELERHVLPRTTPGRNRRAGRASSQDVTTGPPSSTIDIRSVTNPASFFDRASREAREREILAPWATRSADSLGRRWPEEEDELRTAFERDRDRIVHSVAFRRLMYKTQVFVNWEGDHYRTRLSHSLE